MWFHFFSFSKIVFKLFKNWIRVQNLVWDFELILEWLKIGGVWKLRIGWKCFWSDSVCCQLVKSGELLMNIHRKWLKNRKFQWLTLCNCLSNSRWPRLDKSDYLNTRNPSIDYAVVSRDFNWSRMKILPLFLLSFVGLLSAQSDPEFWRQNSLGILRNKKEITLQKMVSI